MNIDRKTSTVFVSHVGARHIAVAALIASLAIPTVAAAQSACGSLWYERNAIYKAAGYCFRTPRAINTFGNAGCQYDDVNDVPLSARQRTDINRIQGAERALRCPR